METMISSIKNLEENINLLTKERDAYREIAIIHSKRYLENGNREDCATFIDAEVKKILK